jgi:tetratricopeptide (TPR) repeat protein
MGLFSRKSANDYIDMALNLFRSPSVDRESTFRRIKDLLFQAQSLEPRNPDIYMIIGWIDNQFNHFESAISNSTRAIELNPQYADAYYNRGYAKSQLMDYHGAISDFDSAIRINPNFNEAIQDREMIRSML